MKTRNGFVSNSSCSSFVINKRYLSPYLLERVMRYQELAPEYDMKVYEGDEWEIFDAGEVLTFSTNMDNFNLTELLVKMGVDSKFIDWKY